MQASLRRVCLERAARYSVYGRVAAVPGATNSFHSCTSSLHCMSLIIQRPRPVVAR